MELMCVSLTGADDRTPTEELNQLSKKHPLLEWAILSSTEWAGKTRFPTDDWVAEFHKACPHVRKAIHLCGNDVARFLDGDARIHAKVAKFDRVQLNFNHRRKPIDVERLISVARKVSPSIIIQHNSANAPLWGLLHKKIVNLAFLFDSSGGAGRQPEQWPDMLPETVCGFSGALGPANIAAEIPRIRQKTGGRRFWLDMESSLRSKETDTFDRAACASVMQQVEQFKKAA